MTKIIMTTEELINLQARLPAGIKLSIIRGNIHYTVRSSRQGKKFSLGTYTDLEDAIQALLKFKQSNEVAKIERKPEPKTSEISFEHAQEIFDEIGVHMLESDKAYIHVTPDGEIIRISSKHVNRYIHLTYYGESQESQESHDIQITDL